MSDAEDKPANLDSGEPVQTESTDRLQEQAVATEHTPSETEQPDGCVSVETASPDVEPSSATPPAQPAEAAAAAETSESEPSQDDGEATETGSTSAERARTGKQGDGAARRKPRFPAMVRAFRSGRLVDGKVEKVIKGGYEIQLGRARGFCPHSQIGLHRENEPDRQVGNSYQFKITQLRRGGEDIVLSRRAVLEEERAEEAKAVRATLIEGAVMQGRVVGAADFGAFIDLGAGVLGLVHISELSHKRVKAVEDAVRIGDTVPVRILKLKDKGRISLSVRRAQDDPWADIESRFEVGRVYPGKIQRIAEFGAFVELAAGVEALAPASEFPPSPGGWKDGLEVGASHDWHVLSVDPRGRRVSVTPPGQGGVTGDAIVEGAELDGRVQRVERYGVFLWLGPGRVGLMPRAMTGAAEGADLRRRFSIGDTVGVVVVGIEEDGRRIRLCKQGVSVSTEDAPAEVPKDETREEPPASFGTSLADKLRAALGQTDGNR